MSLILRLTTVLISNYFLFVVVQAKSPAKWHIKMARRQGPNTCVIEEVPDLQRKLYTGQKYWLRGQICGYKTVLRYVCCEGFTHEDGKLGCTNETNLLDIIDTIRYLGATHFADLIVESGLEEGIKQIKNALTFFVPTNEAFKNLEGIKKIIFEADIRSAVLNHIVENRVSMSDVDNDSHLTTMLNSQTIRVNLYPNQIGSVNCVPIILKDYMASNGMVHLIDGVLVPTKTWPLLDLPSTIIQDGRFLKFLSLLKQTDLFEKLQRNHGIYSYTLFAPFDVAFELVPSYILEELTRNSVARRIFVEHHIIPQTMCPFAIIGDHKLKSFSNKNIDLLCNKSGRFINQAKITNETLFSSNGITNIIQEVLIPDEIRTLYDHLEREITSLKIFKSLLDHCSDMATQFKSTNHAFSLFAPHDEAFKQLSVNQMKFIYDNCESFINHHLVFNKIKSKNIIDGLMLNSLEVGKSLHFKLSRKGVSIDNTSVLRGDIEGINGVMFIINEILVLN